MRHRHILLKFADKLTMVKQILLNWKSVKCVSANGNCIEVTLPQTIDLHYHGTLLTRILSMKKASPLSLVDAANIVTEKQKEALNLGHVGSEYGHYSWYFDNFVSYISNLGYHIELTGDEFEPYIMSDKVG